MSKQFRRSKNRWPSYADVWRWHFYAGVFCIPFVLILSITGTIYLFRPQLEAWSQREMDSLAKFDGKASYAQQVIAAQEATGGWLASLEVISEPARLAGFESATRIITEADNQRLRSFVHPATAEVLETQNEDDGFIRAAKKIHGELLLGKKGSYMVETAASWTMVMVITGIVLWTPRRMRFAGVIYPRLSRSGKVFWRDLHAVFGFWCSGLILFLIATGLPWSTFWGDYFKQIRRWTGTSVATQSWDGGHSAQGHSHKPDSPAKKPKGPSWRSAAIDPSHYQLNEIDAVANFAKSLQWLPPVEVSPPTDRTSVWKIQSTTANRPFRQSLFYDASLGQVTSAETFADKHWVDRLVGNGIALHEGQRFVGTRFGWLNQLLALFATACLMLLSCTGFVLWWRRRPKHERLSLNLHSPKRPSSSEGLVISKLRTAILLGAIGVLAVYLPLFGLTLATVLGGDFLISKTRLVRYLPFYLVTPTIEADE